MSPSAHAELRADQPAPGKPDPGEFAGLSQAQMALSTGISPGDPPESITNGFDLAFIIVKDFRWLAWLVLFVSGIAGGPQQPTDGRRTWISSRTRPRSTPHQASISGKTRSIRSIGRGLAQRQRWAMDCIPHLGQQAGPGNRRPARCQAACGPQHILLGRPAGCRAYNAFPALSI